MVFNGFYFHEFLIYTSNQVEMTHKLKLHTYSGCSITLPPPRSLRALSRRGVLVYGNSPRREIRILNLDQGGKGGFSP